MRVLTQHRGDRSRQLARPSAALRKSVALGLLILCGCGGGSQVQIVPVSGVVTLNDKPLVNATVSFQPEGREAGPASYARTNEHGMFVLRTVDTNQPGAKVGKHRVTITVDAVGDPGDDTGRSAKPIVEIPDRYHRKTELTFDVQPPGNMSATFALTSP